MEALVTIKLTPSQFDTLRDALTAAKVEYTLQARDETIEAASRRTARERAAKLADLERNIGVAA